MRVRVRRGVRQVAARGVIFTQDMICQKAVFSKFSAPGKGISTPATSYGDGVIVVIIYGDGGVIVNMIIW